MKTIVHLSDLHFGHLDPRTLVPLTRIVRSLAPDVVAVSGDLTQRARPREFREARAFLDTLPSPQIVVPGNHDIPLYEVWRRFGSPLEAFTTIVHADPEPLYADAEVAVAGLNTARSLTWKSGRLNRRQLDRIEERFARLEPSVLRVIVTHHPMELPETARPSDLVGRAHTAMAAFARAHVDVFLAGHLHRSHTGATAERYRIAGHSALVVLAGTATSTRRRGEANAFNVLRLSGVTVTLDRYSWNEAGGDFRMESRQSYTRAEAGWGLTPAA